LRGSGGRLRKGAGQGPEPVIRKCLHKANGRPDLCDLGIKEAGSPGRKPTIIYCLSKRRRAVIKKGGERENVDKMNLEGTEKTAAFTANGLSSWVRGKWPNCQVGALEKTRTTEKSEA